MADTLTAGAHAARFARPGAAELVGRSAAVTRVQELVRRAAALDGGVLLTAEAGTAVDSVARELHARSRHSTGPYVIVECANGDAARLDRVLFGETSEDAPTDLEPVSSDSRIAAARGGILFLQDVTELPAGPQARLARIARDGEVRIDRAPVPTAFRLIASTAPGIDGDVYAHRFRADLYRRLSTVRIDVPPLRERAEDVPALAIRLVEDICAAHGIAARTFTQAALALLAALTWPGNLAELHDVIDRVVSETRDEVIHVEHVLPALQLHRAPAPFAPAGNLREARLRFEREYIAAVLQHHDWRMAEAAQTLGIQRPNLYRKARQLGIPLARTSE
jgi:two-component system, NtrC family, nitrogen regulation response regulator NtrX